MGVLCPPLVCKVHCSFPDEPSHTLIERSQDTEAIALPDWLLVQPWTDRECPFKMEILKPLLMSQRLSVESCDAEQMACDPTKHTLLIPEACPMRVWISFPVLSRKSFTKPLLKPAVK